MKNQGPADPAGDGTKAGKAKRRGGPVAKEGANPAKAAAKKSTEPSAQGGAARTGQKKEAKRPGAPSGGGGGAVRLVFLGGLGEIGRNCACIEVDGRIIVLDVGIMFPDPDMPGVDLVLPDFTYLRENAHRVDAVVLTHGHEDHTGGLAYLLRDFPVPVYGSELTLALARNRVDEAGMADRAQFIPVRDGERRRIGPCDVEFIPVTHSVPHAFATAFHTPQGIILHSGDFKIDLHPVDGRRTDLARMGALASEQGIRLLLADSTNAEEPGFTPSESTVGETLRKVFLARPDRRFIVTCFASHIHRVQQVADAAIAGGRKVATLGRSMQKNVALARRLGLLEIPDRSLVDIEDIDKLEDGQVCVISTGSQGEPMSALSRLAAGENRFFRLRPDDVVVISAHPIPGNEWSVGRVIDSLYKRGVEVIHSGVDAVHVSGHARQGELALLMSVTRPEFFIPVHGEFRHMANHVRLAGSMGITGDRVILCEDGDAVRLDGTGLHRDGSVPGGYLFVDGSSVGDIGHGVLRDRMVLSEEGVVMAVATVDLKRGEVVGAPQIVTRGWAYDHDTEALLEEAATAVTKALEEALSAGSNDHESLNRVVRKALGRLVGDRTRQRPMIVPVIVTV
ncbi:MAG TPA: ribonuclease J [Acidimicrobiales bacterium]|jgi:ribonuclease J|nr:ribonuclease J [Acidimicrobiales bacterium]